MRVIESTLREWADAKRAIEEIEGSVGYKLIIARIRQEQDEAEQKLQETWRWNWFRIFRLLAQRQIARDILADIQRVKLTGAKAEDELFKRDPLYHKCEGRASFVHS